jgi:hypothetical protein
MLRTHLTPLASQDNEDLVHLVVDADTGNLHLVDMLLELELLLPIYVIYLILIKNTKGAWFSDHTKAKLKSHKKC